LSSLPDYPRLDDRVAIVTGAGGGIGAATARGLAQRGANLVLADRDGTAAERVAAALVDEGRAAAAIAVDVRKQDEVEAMVELARDRYGGPDILVNNAGIGTTQLVVDLPAEEWRRVLDVNLTGPFLCSRAVLPDMIGKGRGKIVNVASIAAKRISYNGSAGYTASKAGLLAFTRHLAYEVAPQGINVNAVCPGPTGTEMLYDVVDDEALRARVRSVPRGRLATAGDHVHAILFLVSDAADMLCGVALDVDGGALLGWQDVETYYARRQRKGAPR
jgi:NAD(P)-dependent dehydrogenase (short-subunit alcohol dehydrogenase family)